MSEQYRPASKAYLIRTLCQVKAERDAYREICMLWMCGDTVDESQTKFLVWLGVHGYKSREIWQEAFARLEALEETREDVSNERREGITTPR